MKKIYHNPVGVGKYTGLILVLPFIAGFLLFTLYPFVSSFILGLTDYNGITQPNFTGLDNYTAMFGDEKFRNSLAVTLKYMVILVPLKLIISLLVALVLNLEIKGIGIYRTIFYIPSILGSNLAIVIMWQFLFTSNGLVNQFLGTDISWYSSPTGSMAIIILLRLWEFGSAMIIFLNALRDIPKEYYDAAKVDGCGKVRCFFSITLPLLKNVIFLNLILQLISAMQEFNAPYMITGGGPLKSTYTIGMLIYDEMFKYHNAGYANAVSWVLFVLITVIVLTAFRLTNREENK
ncbi:MAG: sugar ABC transporter permease [Ruminococcus flavefaciens]|nr:sugar ABC transporter permease [Ruminococcus flavefaciens]MCM1231414.1 sugar ABC transporter permease [Ruminococcus flavefaciens]